jgi:hypothetical protein
MLMQMSVQRRFLDSYVHYRVVYLRPGRARDRDRCEAAGPRNSSAETDRASWAAQT